MKCGPLLLIALFAAGCGPAGSPAAQTPAEAAQQAGAIKTSTDPKVNPHAAAMADFKARVEKYADAAQRPREGRREAEGRQPTLTQIDAQKTALAAKIQAARAGAKQGDIFAPEIAPDLSAAARAGVEG